MDRDRPRNVRAALFDLDDTLYPYPPCNAAGQAAAHERSRALGYDLDREAFEALYRAGRREVKREVPGTAAAHDRHLYFKRGIETHAGDHARGDALALADAYWEAYFDEMELFYGVEATLRSLTDADVDLAVVTNLTARIQMRKVDRLGIAPHVDVLITSEETGREKPGSAPFTVALSRLDRRPGESVMVGNSVSSDVAGGNAVGLETVLFNGDEDDPADHRCPDHRVDGFGEIAGLVL